MNKIFKFLRQLRKRKIFFSLKQIREKSIMVEIAVPGQRWEIEFLEDGTVEIEKFFSNGQIFGEDEIQILFRDFTD
ncbi:MAG: hypothetical protein ACQETH_15660 [Candidatus Rifleibacteriota bacterium]